MKNTCPECGAKPMMLGPPSWKVVGWDHYPECKTFAFDGRPFTDEPEMLKVVINGGFGGFRLSDKAHWELGSFPRSWGWELPVHLRDLDEIDFRSHYDLVTVVEYLGDDDAHGGGGLLYVVEVPAEFEGNIHIAEYDGNEWVAENHRRWR